MVLYFEDANDYFGTITFADEDYETEFTVDIDAAYDEDENGYDDDKVKEIVWAAAHEKFGEDVTLFGFYEQGGRYA